jgi:hypothetical protein
MFPECAGSEFARNHLRRPARLCYWKVLLEEYAKLLTYLPSLKDRPKAILLDDEEMMQTVKPVGLGGKGGSN